MSFAGWRLGRGMRRGPGWPCTCCRLLVTPAAAGAYTGERCGGSSGFAEDSSPNISSPWGSGCQFLPAHACAAEEPCPADAPTPGAAREQLHGRGSDLCPLHRRGLTAPREREPMPADGRCPAVWKSFLGWLCPPRACAAVEGPAPPVGLRPAGRGVPALPAVCARPRRVPRPPFFFC